MHHTGIKTCNHGHLHKKKPHFNCTIQELKQSKQLERAVDAEKFQLHHTGIKTFGAPSDFDGWAVFQLHHTGIKT